MALAAKLVVQNHRLGLLPSEGRSLHKTETLGIQQNDSVCHLRRGDLLCASRSVLKLLLKSRVWALFVLRVSVRAKISKFETKFKQMILCAISDTVVGVSGNFSWRFF